MSNYRLNGLETKMIVKNKAGEELDVSQLVTSITIQGDYKQGARRLDCSYLASSKDNNIPVAEIKEYDSIYFYNENKLVFTGTIYELSKDSSTNEMTFYAYDNGIVLLKIKDTFNFNNVSITEIVNTIIKKYNIPCESFIKSDLKIDKIFFNQSLYDILMSIYTMLSKKTGKKYMIEWPNYKMKIVEKGQVVLDYGFVESENLINSSYTINLDNIVNRVIIVDENYNYVKEVRDEESMKLYATFQDAIKQSEGEDATELAKSRLQGVERKCTLSGFGDYTCITGRAVKVKDSYTGLVGLFYIDADTHKWENGVYTIDLELNFQNLMNEVDKSEVETENTSSISSSGKPSTTVTGGKKVYAEYTKERLEEKMNELNFNFIPNFSKDKTE